MKHLHSHSHFLRFLLSRKYLFLIALIVVIAFLSTPLTKDEIHIIGTGYSTSLAFSDSSLLSKWLSSLSAFILPPSSIWIYLSPSLVGFLLLGVTSYLFFAGYARISISLLATFLLIGGVLFTSFLHPLNSSLLAGGFIFSSLVTLYRWGEEDRFRGIPWYVIISLFGLFFSSDLETLCFVLILIVLYWKSQSISWKRTLAVVLSLGIAVSFLGLCVHTLYNSIIGIAPQCPLNTASNGLTLFFSGDAPRFISSEPSTLVVLTALLWLLLYIFVPWNKVHQLRKDIYKRHRTTLEYNPSLWTFITIVGVGSILLSLLFRGNFSFFLSGLAFLNFALANFLFFMAKEARQTILIYSSILCGIATVAVLLFLTRILELSSLPEWCDMIRISGFYSWGLIILYIVAILTTIYQIHQKNYSKLTFCIAILLIIIPLGASGSIIALRLLV